MVYNTRHFRYCLLNIKYLLSRSLGLYFFSSEIHLLIIDIDVGTRNTQYIIIRQIDVFLSSYAVGKQKIF